MQHLELLGALFLVKFRESRW